MRLRVLTDRHIDDVAASQHPEVRRRACATYRGAACKLHEGMIHVTRGCGFDGGSATPGRRLLRHAGECLDRDLQFGGGFPRFLYTATCGSAPHEFGTVA